MTNTNDERPSARRWARRIALVALGLGSGAALTALATAAPVPERPTLACCTAASPLLPPLA